MDYKFEIDSESRLIVERWTGNVTLEFLVAGLELMEAQPDFDPTFDVVADYSQARLALSPDELRQFQRVVRSRGWAAMGRRAVVAPRDFNYGIARQAQGLWQVDNLTVFRSEEDAMRWLGEG